MRISKLQKWILQECFKKTILLDNENLEIIQNFRSYHYTEGNNEVKKDSWYWKYLFRDDILLNYFNCETNNNKTPFQRLHHFKGNNNKAQATLTRSLHNMRDKELIELWYGRGTQWQGLVLTELGKEKAIKLLKLNNEKIVYPTQATIKAIEEQKRLNELEIKRIDRLLKS